MLVLLLAGGCGSPQSETRITFDAIPDRVWAGPELYANRLQDWRVRGGRLESVETRTAKPMRTVHLLSTWLSADAGDATISVDFGSINQADAIDGSSQAVVGDSGSRDRSSTWAGLLIGAGGSHVDHRISALVHHWPAEDGGIIVGVDGTGSIVVRDNAVNRGYRRPVGNIPTDAWPIIEPAESEVISEPGESVRLVIQIQPGPRTSDVAWESTYELVVEAHNPDSDVLLARSRYSEVAGLNVDGSIAVVSHGSPNNGGSGYWFNNLSVDGSKTRHDPSREFGPVLGAFHTLSNDVLKLTAQFGPLGSDESRTAALEVRRDGRWVEAARADIVDGSFTASFRVPGWDASKDTPYRVAYDLSGYRGVETSHYVGTIRAVPSDKESFVLAAMNCQNMSGGDGQWNHDHFWYPHAEMVDAVAHHQPDMLFFAGDQIYEAGLEGVERSPVQTATLDYLNHWYRFVFAFRDLARDIPAVIIPDDHDVYHGNVWGNGGVREPGTFSPPTDAGGYVMDPEWVNMVHRTQVSHLPDPVDPEPIANGITVYHTSMEYAGISFAILADRMWKSPPVTTVPDADVWNGWPQREGYDAHDADVPGAQLLGPRQLSFLDNWALDWSGGTWMKVVLSQTLFANLATIPESAASGAVLPGLSLPKPGEYQRGDKVASDMDSNGWPQTGRNEALRRMRKGFAFHIAGDQHLGSYVHYGIDAFGDAGNAFVVPSIANIWPRRWFPPEPGMNRDEGAPDYTGEFFDGLGNRMTVHAVANPVDAGVEPSALYDRSPGYGIIRFDRETREITSEAWPRWVDPASAGANQYDGWPVTVPQEANFGRRDGGALPQIDFASGMQPVVLVVDEVSRDTLYAIRPPGASYRPLVPDEGRSYTVIIRYDGDDGSSADNAVLTNQRPSPIEPPS